MIDPPMWLSVEARKIFHETCNRLEHDGRPPERYAMVAAMYAQASAEWSDACQNIITVGTIIRRGERMFPNPEIQVRDAAHAKMERLSDELGLSPGSAIAKDEPWDPDDYCDTLEDVLDEMAEEALSALDAKGEA